MRIQKLREQGKDFAALLTCMQTLPRPEAPATPTYYVVPPAEMQQAFRLHRRADTTPATQRGALHPSCGTPLATAAGFTHHAHVPPLGRATAPPGSAVPTSCAFRRFPRHHLRARITPSALKSFEYRRASSTWARLIARGVSMSRPLVQVGRMPLSGVHRVASLAKRWLFGTHQGAVEADHLQAYLNEFCFRFNRRDSRAHSLLFYRLMQLSAGAPPVIYRQLVANPRPKRVPPTGPRPRPGSLALTPPGRPWQIVRSLD